MNFENFLKSIILIAKNKYPQLNQSFAIRKLISKFFLPLYDQLNKDKTIKYEKEDHYLFEIKFNQIMSFIFLDVGPILLQIYKTYFPHETSGQITF